MSFRGRLRSGSRRCPSSSSCSGCCTRSCCRSSPAWRSPICSIRSANRLERLGMNRLVATLAGDQPVRALPSSLLIILIVPILGAQLAAFIENTSRATWRACRGWSPIPAAPWLRKIVGERLPRRRRRRAGRAGLRLPRDLPALAVVGRAGADLDLLAARGHAGGRLLSALRLGPHGCDGRQLGAGAASRDGAQAGARDRRARSPASCAARPACASSSARSMRSALSLTGLNFGLLIGLVSGLISFIPYVGSMTGLVVALGVAVAQFWPDWTLDPGRRRRSSSSASSSRATCCRPSWSARASACIRCG